MEEFGRRVVEILGVTVQYSFGSIVQYTYYLAVAWLAVKITIPILFTLFGFTFYKMFTYGTKDLSDEDRWIIRVIVFCFISILCFIPLFGIPESVATIMSPDGYVITKLLNGVNK